MDTDELCIDRTLPGSCGVLGLGVFDGCHLAHQELAKHCDTLLSLFPHPRMVLGNESCQYLSMPEERKVFYERSLVLRFTPEVATLSALSFLEKLCHQLSPTGFVVGYDFRFGHQREGDASFLRDWAKDRGLSCRIVPCFRYHDTVVKSGVIRTAIREGKFDWAVTLLGHPYVVTGDVITGDGRGKSLGFPTANLSLAPEKLLPAPGVYAARLISPFKDHSAIVYVGSKPTFSGKGQHLEVHVPNFEGSLYHQRLQLGLYKHIRDEKVFASRDALISQIKQDLEALST
ncbi:MAG: riboflavin biosynthesis protein RibF [bacterium]